MLERLFRYPKVLARHREAPFLAERDDFLEHCASQGMARSTLAHVADELLVVVRRLDLTEARQPMTCQQIEAAAARWARHQRRRGHCLKLRWSQKRFTQVATHWLRFIERLEIDELKPSAGEQWIEPFTAYMQNERGLSILTIRNSRWHLEKFFAHLTTQHRTLAQATIADIDAFLESLAQRGWTRVSLAKSAKTLRAFLRYAEQRGWCVAGISAGIVSPRVFRDEGLPVGPDWSDVERLIRSAGGDSARDIRDRAILQLLAIYGLRRGEVARLRLEDLNWTRECISITRHKQRRSQEYPLLPCVAESILRYLEHARPKSSCREVFVTLKAPLRPISPSGLYNVVSKRLRTLEIRSRCYGPHALRHACAGRLVAEGLSLKQIGDHLGHRSANSTRTYAKVDLAGLREVADLSLGGLL